MHFMLLFLKTLSGMAKQCLMSTHNICFHEEIGKKHLTLLMLNTTCTVLANTTCAVLATCAILANSVDPDQLASEEAN